MVRIVVSELGIVNKYRVVVQKYGKDASSGGQKTIQIFDDKDVINLMELHEFIVEKIGDYIKEKEKTL